MGESGMQRIHFALSVESLRMLTVRLFGEQALKTDPVNCMFTAESIKSA
jgi:hypothetical protein